MNEWSIRVCERRDVNELLFIEQAQFPEPWTKGMLLDEITNTETRRYTVAVAAKKIVGYLGVMFVLDELHVNTIGTRAGFEGRGIASRMAKHVLTDLKQRGLVILPTCPFFAGYLKKHPEYAELVHPSYRAALGL